MAKPTLEVLVGMIASGKSTYCKARARDGAVIVNDDAVVLAIHGGHYDLYTDRLRPLYKYARSMLIRGGLMMGRDVIVDSTNLSARRRRKMLDIAEECRARAIAVVFPLDRCEVHANRRAKSDSRGIPYERWLSIARAHRSAFEPVTPDEGFEEIRIHETL